MLLWWWCTRRLRLAMRSAEVLQTLGIPSPGRLPTGSLPVVDLLLEHGADLAAPCNAGKTALHYAAEVGVSASVMERLSETASAAQSDTASADQAETEDSQPAQTPAAQWRDTRRRTPLHYAASQGNWTNVKLLLRVRSCLNRV